MKTLIRDMDSKTQREKIKKMLEAANETKRHVKVVLSYDNDGLCLSDLSCRILAELVDDDVDLIGMRRDDPALVRVVEKLGTVRSSNSEFIIKTIELGNAQDFEICKVRRQIEQINVIPNLDEIKYPGGRWSTKEIDNMIEKHLKTPLTRFESLMITLQNECDKHHIMFRYDWPGSYIELRRDVRDFNEGLSSEDLYHGCVICNTNEAEHINDEIGNYDLVLEKPVTIRFEWIIDREWFDQMSDVESSDEVDFDDDMIANFKSSIKRFSEIVLKNPTSCKDDQYFECEIMV